MDLFMSSYSYFSKISRTNPIYNLSIESAGQISQVPIHKSSYHVDVHSFHAAAVLLGCLVV